jgi:hypothetical protein
MRESSHFFFVEHHFLSLVSATIRVGSEQV